MTVFKVGDRVFVNDITSSHYLYPGELIGTDPKSNICTVKLDAGYVMYYHEYHLAHIKLSPLSPSSSRNFQAGDKVKLVGNKGCYMYAMGTTATIIHISSFIIIEIDSHLIQYSIFTQKVYDTSDIELVTAAPVHKTTITAAQLTGATSSGVGITLGSTTNSKKITISSDMTSTGAMLREIDAISTLHACIWKFYMGLNQRYEYCTICDKKRDTDRRS